MTFLFKKRLLLILTTLFINQQTLAHSRWIQPSHTTLSGNKEHHVTLDISISNQIFHADKALRANAKGKFPSAYLTLTLPNGDIESPLPWTEFTRKSVADIKLDESGTYKASVHQPGIVFTIYQQKDGKRGKAFGSQKYAKIPPQAKVLKTIAMEPVAETFISRNKHTPIALSNKGLEWKFITHPNELFVGEPATLELFFNGKAVKGITASVIKGGTRYRNERSVQKLITNTNGQIEINWQSAGMYLIEVSYETKPTNNSVDAVNHKLFTTLEVNPD